MNKSSTKSRNLSVSRPAVALRGHMLTFFLLFFIYLAIQYLLTPSPPPNPGHAGMSLTQHSPCAWGAYGLVGEPDNIEVNKCSRFKLFLALKKSSRNNEGTLQNNRISLMQNIDLQFLFCFSMKRRLREQMCVYVGTLPT